MSPPKIARRNEHPSPKVLKAARRAKEHKKEVKKRKLEDERKKHKSEREAARSIPRHLERKHVYAHYTLAAESDAADMFTNHVDTHWRPIFTHKEQSKWIAHYGAAKYHQAIDVSELF